jgi:hypothetical protein
MPGREDLIQQNIARVRSKVSEPTPQEEQGKSAESAANALNGGPKSFFGGNYDVYSTLDSIQFQGALGDASMRGNIAYIRVWKRGGTAAQTNSGAPTQDPGANDTWSALNRDMEARLGVEREDLPDGAFVSYTSDDPLSYTIESRDLVRDGDEAIESGSAQTFFVSPPNSERQQAIGTQTPTSSATPSPASVSALRESLKYPLPTNRGGIGAVRSANPNGFTNILSKAARSFIGLPLTKPKYSGRANAPKSETASAPPGEMMWQFLFNPSELELEAGPEFKGAETWGVSDKANSGQPLHWSHNKNAQLKFNSVLLNGFVFGRKVEALEQGLIELFMSRDGEGQHGPHVLEFVWGKRSFGPCVIKNINVKEKMWDEGEVVNAELSFTLEQIPEWTINDGAYVDVARPGRQPLVAEVATQQPSEQPITNPPPGGGSSGDQKPKPTPTPGVNLNLKAKCTNLRSAIRSLEAIKSSPNTFGFAAGNPDQAQKRFRLYNNIYKNATLNQIAPINVGDYSPDDIEKKINREWDRAGQGQTTPGRLLIRYPFVEANKLLSRGVGFLTGSLKTQVQSSTCVSALR